ncbi:MAG: D-TA family PLP-dependent enzyme [Verrucomicrobiales bacterium]|nr:D-TA family PLP-dependent enzyme [Verrucomicrobiales bacterium]
MNTITNLETTASPALLFDADAINRNLDLMLKIVGGDPSRLRPHIKTHKCREILTLQLALGITQVKCATIAEAELSAIAGVPDVLISYPLVGPNVDRFFQLIETYPATKFSTLVDCERALEAFVSPGGAPVSLFIDLDCGMHRTGIAPGEAALNLVRTLVANPAIHFAGVHAYDGHIHDAPLAARKEQFDAAMAILDGFVDLIEDSVAPVPLVVAGGSPTFALHAAAASISPRPRQCSPGTTVLWDCGYGGYYDDLVFEPAAFLLTRVVSHPGGDHPGGDQRICVDLGHKSVAAENVIGRRVRFPAIPEARFVSQSEEHLVLEGVDPAAWPVGTSLIGIPIHVCPTVALHQEARIVRDHSITGESWDIAARNRRITI